MSLAGNSGRAFGVHVALGGIGQMRPSTEHPLLPLTSDVGAHIGCRHAHQHSLRAFHCSRTWCEHYRRLRRQSHPGFQGSCGPVWLAIKRRPSGAVTDLRRISSWAFLRTRPFPSRNVATFFRPSGLRLHQSFHDPVKLVLAKSACFFYEIVPLGAFVVALRQWPP